MHVSLHVASSPILLEIQPEPPYSQQCTESSQTGRATGPSLRLQTVNFTESVWASGSDPDGFCYRMLSIR